jgi:flagellar biosynthesis anti-sigma factor FlgM
MIDSVGNGNLSNVQRAAETARGATPMARSGPAVVGGGCAPAASILTELASPEAPVRADRVSELRAAIAEGRYAVSAERIAKAMVG